MTAKVEGHDIGSRLEINAETVRQMVTLNGLDLSLERAEALIPALQAILEVDARIAELQLRAQTAVGLPWIHGGTGDDRQW